MDIENAKSWATQPDVCRCCLATNGVWDVTASYNNNGIKEVFSEMIHECFGITLSYLTEWGPSRLICSTCASHLREAIVFRKKVLLAEKQFTEVHQRSEVGQNVDIKFENVKCESNSEDCAENYSEDEVLNDQVKLEPNSTSHNTVAENSTSANRKRLRKSAQIKEIQSESEDSDSDSDTPISELTLRKGEDESVSAVERLDGLNVDKINKNEKLANASRTNSAPTQRTTSRQSKNAEMSALRSNVALILNHSTICPFKSIKAHFNCFYCDKNYLFFNELKTHMKENHVSNEKLIIDAVKQLRGLVKADISEIKCVLCQEKSNTIESFVDHLVDVHKKKYYSIKTVPSHGIMPFDLSTEQIKCHICNKEFRVFKNLSTHMNEHSENHVCHICGKKFFFEHRLQCHFTLHKKDIKCKFCSKQFDSVPVRNYHIYSVHTGIKFKCPQCPEIFTQYHHRIKHLVEVHNMRKPEFKCNICLKEFATNSGMRAHIGYAHMNDRKKNTCEICDRSFLTKSILKRHMIVHTGEKKFKCDYCEKRYARATTLKEHLRIHLNDKRFKCSVCTMGFVQKCSLKNHIRVHHPDSNIDVGSL